MNGKTTIKIHAIPLAAGDGDAGLHPSTTIKRLGILLLWAFDHKIIPKSLLTARLGLGIQQEPDSLSTSHFGAAD
jgi:hypothetical protein